MIKTEALGIQGTKKFILVFSDNTLVLNTPATIIGAGRACIVVGDSQVED